MTTRKNDLDQFLDIAGSFSHVDTKTLTDEPNSLGQAVSGQTGSAASIDAVVGGIVTVSGLTGMTATGSVGNFITISGAATAANNGTFLITSYISATSVTYSNSAGVAGDANNGSIGWTERAPYSLEDDINFERTDRAAIKGVQYYDPIPTYDRPTAVGTLVPANLTNIADKTLDAHAWVINRKFCGIPVTTGDGYVTFTSAGNLKYADAIDRTGVPINDGADAGNDEAVYVEIVDGYDEAALEVLTGPFAGHRIFGRTRAGTTGSSPDSVEIEFRSVSKDADISTSVPYTWEAGQPTTICAFYGYRERADQLTETAFRTILTNGLIGDADLRQDVIDIRQVIGVPDDTTDLAGLLTNLNAYYPFYDLPDATPSVVEALNTLNEQIGDRDYTGTILTDGYTITQSLQQLADAIVSGAQIITRIIERLTAVVPKNTAHTLPGGNSYTQDGTYQAAGMWVFWRGVLRHPGPVVNGNDYDETTGTSITPYSRLNSGDIIDYFIIA
jgi:hypothetical protein